MCSQPSRDNILVVDDSPDNVFLIQTILEEEGYTISTAEDGSTALRLVEQSPPQLVLLDVMMPGMDGFEVTQRIRRNSQLPFIPILLITAYDQPSVAQGLDMGADDFIRKPVEVDELLARVRSLLRLKHSVDERDQIARQREDFVSRLTHDLRTPLVAADRMLALFQQGALGELSPTMKEAIATMARSNQNLLQMVNTLLEVYRFEADRKVLNFMPIDLQEILAEVVKELEPLAQEKNLPLQLDVESQDNPKVIGDRLEIHRLFTNLVGNAIKFTDSGSVTVRIKPSNKAADKYITIEVADTGTGIPQEEQATLFERFRQGSHKRSGSGLGLYLSRRIVEAHQGTIEVRSTPGQGSVFSVDLPITQ
ncbi:hybrid sensor histidine kinase/response regulator [Chroococcidiopsis sp. TS-821]|uniref:hybrid sensor histidine kinase/response regulator n=1 Tax=Chroococcidiopsis sp. TS-821 TaxID=1378066 RepID=UPI000CEE597F|nr:hybrid sensor histidine kinase/response regulator [Chroococcidiopsis sp. TS-821]PPS45801.1 hybrid sensor histidine kinase/response regulator [Chroococcidiopsis sp. TS-821]